MNNPDWGYDPFMPGRTTSYRNPDKPTLVGESLATEGIYTVTQMVTNCYDNGYAGIMPWSYWDGDGVGTWNGCKQQLKTFRDAYSDIVDFSSATVTYEITLIYPNGGEICYAGENKTVIWTNTGIIGNVNISLSTNSGSTWINLVQNTANDSSQTITVPDTPSNSCRIMVSETDGTPSDTSDTNFSIITRQIPVLLVDKMSLEFGEIPIGRTKTPGLQIMNASGGTLTGIISCPDEWVSIVPESFSGNTVANVKVDNKVLGMKEGIWISTVTVISNGGVAEIPLTLTATCVLVKPNPFNPDKGNLAFFGNGIVTYKTE